jgi:hypothetical protein
VPAVVVSIDEVFDEDANVCAVLEVEDMVTESKNLSAHFAF